MLFLSVFGINGEFGDSEDMSIFGTTDGDAALLAISVLLQGELSEGQFTERLADFNLGFKETGTWDNETVKSEMAKWTLDISVYSTSSLASIGDNILSWNLSSVVPDFEKFVKNYWYAYYDIGTCDISSQNIVKSIYREDINSYYTCKNNAWTPATDLEVIKYQWGTCSKEGEIKDSPVPVYNDKGVSINRYICRDNAWDYATILDIDTYQWICTEGEINEGQVSDTKYICKDNVWKIATKCLESKSCLTFTDARDGKNYFSVKIGEQTWMAENLNYNANGSKCYYNEDYCAIYGKRLYDWTTAMMACPEGWHLPSKGEWETLMTVVGRESGYFKATSGWDGTDEYGFSALPGGFAHDGFIYVSGGYWWSSSEYDNDHAYYWYILGDIGLDYNYPHYYLLSIRCVKDD